MTDSIIKTIEIAAPVEKMWDALTDHRKSRRLLDRPHDLSGL
ncbi:hypothetical protein [Sphingobium sp. Leaf26]|nr:hypothetical protein [Sphingobium sp. Leaf26]